MRILLTGQPIYSHLMPVMVPFARHARARGHHVALATAPSMAADLAAQGVPHVPLPHVASQAELRSSPALARRYGMPDRVMAPGSFRVLPGVAEQISHAYAGLVARDFAADLLDTTFTPDVIVRESAEYGGYLAAEALGVPHATLDVIPFQADELPVVTATLDAERTRLGIPSTDDPHHPHRHLTAGLLPVRWYPDRLHHPTLRHYRSPVGQSRSAGTDGAPIVYASFGSLVLSLAGVGDLLPIVMAALGRLPARCVLALGGHGEFLDRLGPVPDNVTVTVFAAQRVLLTQADLFITHAGFGATVEAVAAGVPMVALPVIADQPDNARRAAELGIGEWLDIEHLDAAELADTCRRVRDDAGPRRRIGELRRELFAAPDFDALLDDLGALL